MPIDPALFKKAIMGFDPTNTNTVCWCDNIECTYCQKGNCIAGPELAFTKNYTEINGRKKPVMICGNFCPK